MLILTDKIMKRSKEKVTVKWSKREGDWVSHYPECENRNARILGNNFFTMIQEFEKWKGESLRQVLINGGFDPDTFTISVNAKVNDDVS
jgi:hypothetical protein